MEVSSSPLSPVPASLHGASVRDGACSSSPLESHRKIARMPPRSRLSRHFSDATESAPTKTKGNKPGKTHGSGKVTRAKSKAQNPANFGSVSAVQTSRQTRRASVKNSSYEESETEDETADAQTRGSSSEIDIDAPPAKVPRGTTMNPSQDQPSPPQDDSSCRTEPVTNKKRQPLRGNWSASHLLQSDKSKLKDCDLESLLCHSKAWTSLSPQQQHELCSMLPNSDLYSSTNTPIDSPLPNHPQQLLKSNSTFRSHLRLFQEELAAGRFDPVWLADAQTAMEKRAAGTFDAWKESEREKFWGQKQKVSWLATAGDSAKWTLLDMARGGCFQVGDVWIVSRSVRRANASLTVQKEATLLAMAEDWTLSFGFPPGRHALSAPTNGADKVVDGVDNPNALAKAITVEDGRIPASHRSPNAWREVRCLRRNQDMGSLWDVRETFHNKQSAE